MANTDYISAYTGEQIDQAINNVYDATYFQRKMSTTDTGLLINGADSNIISLLLKNINTNHETAQETSSNESLKGDGTFHLHRIAKTGTYAHLIGKPVINTDNSVALAVYTNAVINGTINLHKVSSTGTYTDLISIPVINTNNASAQSILSNYAMVGTINLHKIASTGSYADLLNKPTLTDFFIVTDVVIE